MCTGRCRLLVQGKLLAVWPRQAAGGNTLSVQAVGESDFDAIT